MDRYTPFATSNSPAVSNARCASRGNCSRTTEAAIVNGIAAVASSSLLSCSGEAEGGGEGEVVEVAMMILFQTVGYGSLSGETVRLYVLLDR